MKNYISINISYTKKVNYLERKDIAKKYGLTTSAIGTYENNKSLPNIKFIQAFCKDHDINIDDFVNKDLSKNKKIAHHVSEPATTYQTVDEKTEGMYKKIIKYYENLIQTKNDLIAEKNITSGFHLDRINRLEHEILRLKAILNQNGLNP